MALESELIKLSALLLFNPRPDLNPLVKYYTSEPGTTTPFLSATGFSYVTWYILDSPIL